MPSVAQIQEIARPIVESKGAYIVDVAIRHEGRGKFVEIFADTDRGITTDLCADISRDVSHAFDLSDFFPERYYLVVSSPGIDRPLILHRQYLKNVGRTVTVTYKIDQQTEKIQGELVGTSEGDITLRLENDETKHVNYDNIIEARVNTPW